MSKKFTMHAPKNIDFLCHPISMDEKAALSSAVCEDKWKFEIWKQISDHINDEFFPCIFARQAIKNKFVLLAFLDRWESAETLDCFRKSVEKYILVIKDIYFSGEICPPLMAVFKPEEQPQTLEYYSDASWRILQYLHDSDDYEWPDNIPIDTEHPLWSFCFNGCQLFINITSPALGKHRSRVLSDSLVLTIQPRTNFDIMAGKNTTFGHKVREQIRRRWMHYDGLESVSGLSMYGDDHNREWKQYFLYSDESPAPMRCPLNIKKK